MASNFPSDDVYNFCDDPEEVQIESEAATNYQKVKEKLGFIWWTLKKTDAGISVVLDGKDLVNFLKEKDIEVPFGYVIDVGKLDHHCIELKGSEGAKLIYAIWDFQQLSNEFSKTLPKEMDTSKFCASLKEKLKYVKKNDNGQTETETTTENEGHNAVHIHDEDKTEEIQNEDKTEEISDEDNTEEIPDEDNTEEIPDEGNTEEIPDEDKTEEIPDEDKTEEIKDVDKTEEENLKDGDKAKVNEILAGATRKKLGQFQVRTENLVFAEGRHAVREINAQHMSALVAQAEANYSNEKITKFPSAVGLVIGDDRNKIKEQLKEDKIIVECIDGNHTLGVFKQLAEKYPEEEFFKRRSVEVYMNLTQAEIFTIGLMHNEVSSMGKETTPIEKVRIMRTELYDQYDGIFSLGYQEHIYSIFNAVCPENKALQIKKRKKLQHLIRLSTMANECWKIVEQINKKKPTQTIYRYTELSKLGIDAAKTVLQKILNGRKMVDLKKLIEESPQPSPDEDLALQRLREQKKMRKNKNLQEKRHDDDAIPEDHNQEDNGINIEVPEQSYENIEETATEFEEVKKENVQLVEKNQNLNQKIEEMTKKKESDQSYITELMSHCKETTTELREVKREKDNLVEKLKIAATELEEVKKENDKLVEKNQGLYRELEELKNTLENLKKTKQETKEETNNTQREQLQETEEDKEMEEDILVKNSTLESEGIAKRSRSVKNYAEIANPRKEITSEKESVKKQEEKKKPEKRKLNRVEMILENEKDDGEEENMPFSFGLKKKKSDTEGSTDMAEFKVGSCVIAFWKKGKISYPAKILGKTNIGYTVQYDEDDMIETLPAHYIKKPQ